MTAVLGGKQIARKHLNAVQKICDHRNAFIHYKYPTFNVNKHVSVDPSLVRTLSSFEATVKYLQDFDAVIIKKRVRAKIKRFALDDKKGRTKR